MTVRIAVHHICDRCEKPYNEAHFKSGETLPQIDKLVWKATRNGDHSGEVLFYFEDLCPDCISTVENLIARIRLDPVKKSSTSTTPTEAVVGTDPY